MKEEVEERDQPFCNKRLFFGVIGCFGGLFIHLIIGSLYQWGIINIYITSYYRLADASVTLENNAIAFPIMMLCIGLTMRLGLFLAQLTHPIIVLAPSIVIQSALIFSSSYVSNMGGFIVVYGVIFGLFSGINFMIPIVQCNKYFPGKKMYVNGVILTGTGLGSLVFGLFSYGFLNPNKVPPIKGYYIGNSEVEGIAAKVPQCLRWLSLLYILIGLSGVLMISYVCKQNRIAQQQIKQHDKQAMSQSKQEIQIKKKNQTSNLSNLSNQINLYINQSSGISLQQLKKIQEINIIKQSKEQPKKKQEFIKQAPTPLQVGIVIYPTDLKEAFCTRVCWLQTAIIFFGSCGLLLLNGNYKTYVKNNISDDQFLTIIGVIGSIGNGCSRFFWNLLFLRTGYRFVIVLNLSIQIVVYIALRFTVYTEGGYLFLIFLSNCCIGGFLVMTPTFLQLVFGERVGSNIYGFFWQIFGLANLVQYAYVSGLSPKITFNNVIYICLGMSVISLIIVTTANFEAPWKNPQDLLGYCKDCNKKQQQQK